MDFSKLKEAHQQRQIRELEEQAKNELESSKKREEEEAKQAEKERIEFDKMWSIVSECIASGNFEYKQDNLIVLNRIIHNEWYTQGIDKRLIKEFNFPESTKVHCFNRALVITFDKLN